MFRRTRKSLRQERDRKRLTKNVKKTLLTTACGLWSLTPAFAEVAPTEVPVLDKVVAGDVSVNTTPITVENGDTTTVTGNIMDVNQTSNKAIINWTSFNLGEASTVNFNHMKGVEVTVDGVKTTQYIQDNSAITLNRIASNNMSEIYGKINSVGSIILVNPNGILFGGSSEVNAAGIVASTADIKDTDWDANKLIFRQDNESNNNITVLGTMNASINGDYLAENSDYQQHLAAMSQEATALNMGNRQKVTGFSHVGNKIMLVADGDVAVGKNAQLTAITQTTVDGGGTDGSESFSVGGDSSTRESSIVIRADQNADDVAIWDSNVEDVANDGSYTYNKNEQFTYSSKGHTVGVHETDVTDEDGNVTTKQAYLKTAKVYLSNDNKLQSQNIGVYWDSDVTSAGVSNNYAAGTGTAATDININDSTQKTFTQKDYTTYGTEASKLQEHANVGSKVSVTYKTYKVNDNGTVTSGTGSDTVDYTFATLVNNVYQLQAIGTSIDTKDTDNNAYGNVSATYALGTTIAAADTANWNKSDGTAKGFDPIGNQYNNFFGGFTGNGGSNTYGIYDLNINRTSEEHVGLFAHAVGAKIWTVSVIDPLIKGVNSVGGIAGSAENTWFDNVTMRKRVAASDGETTKTANESNVYGTENNVGGIVGSMVNSTIRYGINGGQVENGVDGVGGLAGSAAGMLSGQKFTIGYYSQNKGYYSDSENVDNGYGVVKGATNTTDKSQGGSAGGLVGIAGAADKTTVITGKSYSNGQVSGRSNVGGIVGQTVGANTTISQVYNTNETGALTTVVKKEDLMGAGSSKYGKVSSIRDTVGCVGGIVGFMNDGTVSESYNAGNISGPSSVGGVVGNMQNGTIVNSYSADNNTVLKTSTNNGEYYGFTYGSDKYTYDHDKQCWYKNGDTTKALSTETVLEEAPESGRLYNNRLAYRDATVTATGENGTAGGVVGNFAGGMLKNTYAAGKVSSTGTGGKAGGIIGRYDTTSNVEKSAEGLNFYVTTQNVTNKDLSGLGTGKAVGDGTFAGSDSTTLKDVTLWQAQNLASSTSDGVSGAVSWINESEKKSTNQDNTWMVYSNSATPLLKCFMNWININRQYVYDGTVHNLMTTDVSNYYGGAFFTNGKGQNVYTEGVTKLSGVDSDSKPSSFVYSKNNDGITASASDTTEYSSFYQYDNANMWSPQHGYYTDPTAGMIITPKTATATLTGTKTYGDIVKGYYYNDGTENGNYIYNENTTKWEKAAAGTDLTEYYKLTVKGSNDKQVTLLKEDGSTYLVGLDDITLNGHTGTTETMYGSDDTAEQQTNAGTYTAKNKQLTITGDIRDTSTTDADGNEVTAYNTYNYVFNYDGSLQVNKAKLIVNASGTREYGESNGKLTDISIIGQSADTDEDKKNNGKLKSWDVDGTKVTDSEGNITYDATKLAGYTNSATNNTLVATETTKNTKKGVTTTSTTIDEGTWVKNDNKQAGTYTLGKGSLLNANGKSELASSNYDIVYVANADDAMAKSFTGDTNATGTTLFNTYSSDSTYKITPVALKYNVIGEHTYGAEQIAQEYTVSPDNAASLKNGDKLDKLVEKKDLDELGKSAAVQAKITTDSHVKRGADGEVVAYEYKDLSNSVEGWTNDVELADNNINYLLTVNDLKYTVTPATLTVTTASASKTYGDAAFTTTGANGITGWVKGEGTGYDETTGTGGSFYDASQDTTVNGKANVTQITGGYVYEDADGNDLTDVKANAGTYEEASKPKNENLYFNDYNVVYNKGTVTITPKSVGYKVEDAHKTYGETTLDSGSILTGTVDGLVNGDTIDTADESIYSTPELANAKTNVGDYTITVDAETLQKLLGNNYELDTTKVTNGTLTVNQREVTYTVNDNTKIYGNDKADTTLSGTFSNLVEGDTVGTAKESDFTSDGLDKTANVKDDYALTIDKDVLQALLTKNYKLVQVNDGTLKVTPRSVDYIINNNSKIYGETTVVDEANNPLSGGFDSTAFVNGDTVFDAATSGYASEGMAEKANVREGGYEITIDEATIKALITNSNYQLGTIKKGTLTITPKSVTYKVNDNTKTYGNTATNTALSGEFSGLTDWDDGNFELTDDAYTSNGLTDRANAGDYTLTVDKSKVEKTLNGNYKLTDVTTGNLTVEARDVEYTVDNATREYLADNPAFTGSFDNLTSWDKVNIGQGAYSTTTTVTSEVGSYTDDITANETALQNALGNNYKLTKVNNGDMTITQANLYYKSNGATYRTGDEGIETDVQTGTIVNGAGKDVTRYLTGEDISFTVEEGVTSETERGQYGIFGSGVVGNKNYKMADNPQLPANATALTIKIKGMDNQGQYEAAKDSMEIGARNGADTNIISTSGGFIPEEARNQLRLLTVEDTGIKLDTIVNVDREITIGGGTVLGSPDVTGGNTANGTNATTADASSNSSAGTSDGNTSVAGGSTNGTTAGTTGATGTTGAAANAGNGNAVNSDVAPVTTTAPDGTTTINYGDGITMTITPVNTKASAGSNTVAGGSNAVASNTVAGGNTVAANGTSASASNGTTAPAGNNAVAGSTASATGNTVTATGATAPAENGTAPAGNGTSQSVAPGETADYNSDTIANAEALDAATLMGTDDEDDDDDDEKKA